MRPARVYGLMAEFERPEDLRRAVRTVREQGYRRLDAYTPLPIDGLAEEMGLQTLVSSMLNSNAIRAAE